MLGTEEAQRLRDEEGVASGFLETYQTNPLAFVRNVLGSKHMRYPDQPFAWPAQRYIMEAVRDHPKVAVRGCRSVGKSRAVGGQIIPWWVYTGLGACIGMAPTERQILKVVWGELRRAVSGSRRALPGQVTAKEIKIDDNHWALAIPCRNPDSLRGFHAGIQDVGDPDQDDPLDGFTPEEIERALHEADNEGRGLLIAIDEPEAIEQGVFDVLRGMQGRPNVRTVMIGNPMLGVDDDHEFVRAFNEDSGWHTVHISGLPLEEYPDATHADVRFDHVPEYLLPRTQLDSYIKDYEPDDPVFKSDVLGQFSDGSTLSLVVPRTALEVAIQLWPERHSEIGPRIGVDIGTGRPDPCVASLFMDGLKVSEKEWRPAAEDKQAQVSVAHEIARLGVGWGRMIGEAYPTRWSGQPITDGRISIDDSGLVGVGDILSNLGISVDRVNFGGPPDYAWASITGTILFANARAELYWNCRRLLQEGLACIPRSFRKSYAQAQYTHYEREATPDGPRILLEKKRDIIQRYGRSPDHADADVLALRPTGQGMQVLNAGSWTPRPSAPGEQRYQESPLRTKLGPGWRRISP